MGVHSDPPSRRYMAARGLEPCRAAPREACAPALAESCRTSQVTPALGLFPFPGLKKMQSSLKLVDCILEVHDARISFRVMLEERCVASGRFPAELLKPCGPSQCTEVGAALRVKELLCGAQGQGLLAGSQPAEGAGLSCPFPELEAGTFASGQ